MNILLEVCAFTIQGCIAAYEGGAQRIELCQAPYDGGTTPSLGLQKMVMAAVPIPIYPIVRPRGGDFLYTKNDVDAMAYDIEAFEKIGCQGVVIGALHANGFIDEGILKTLIYAAKKMDITVHRAFDRCNNPYKALETIIKLGGKRILTSGLKPDANNGLALLAQLVKIAGSACIIMPGSGVRANNAKHIIEQTNATEIHTSARSIFNTAMQYTNPAFGEIENEGSYVGINKKDVEEICQQLRSIA